MSRPQSLAAIGDELAAIAEAALLQDAVEREAANNVLTRWRGARSSAAFDVQRDTVERLLSKANAEGWTHRRTAKLIVAALYGDAPGSE